MSNNDGISQPPAQRRRRPPAPHAGALVSYPESAVILGVSLRTLMRLIAEGRIPVVKVSERKRYILRSELEAYLERASKPATK